MSTLHSGDIVVTKDQVELIRQLVDKYSLSPLNLSIPVVEEGLGILSSVDEPELLLEYRKDISPLVNLNDKEYEVNLFPVRRFNPIIFKILSQYTGDNSVLEQYKSLGFGYYIKERLDEHLRVYLKYLNSAPDFQWVFVPMMAGDAMNLFRPNDYSVDLLKQFVYMVLSGDILCVNLNSNCSNNLYYESLVKMIYNPRQIDESYRKTLEDCINRLAVQPGRNVVIQ